MHWTLVLGLSLSLSLSLSLEEWSIFELSRWQLVNAGASASFEAVPHGGHWALTLLDSEL
jgi:hypothetical protein